MDVRSEEETAERGREGRTAEGSLEEEEKEEGACWRSRNGTDRQARVRACVRGRRAGKLTGPMRVPQVTCALRAQPARSGSSH